jgi:hypothetical protein
MRLNPKQIRKLSEQMVSELGRHGLVELIIEEAEAVSFAEQAITEDLRVEDKLNEEVKNILTAYAREIEQGRVDYNTMFDMVKKKLVRERGLII